MIRGMIRMISRRRGWFTPSLRMVVCIPSGSTEVEIRAVRDSSEHAGGRDVYMIYEPMAAAIGVGIDVLAPEGHMIVDIGGGTTEIAVISLGGIVEDQSIDTAGDELTQDIMDHMREKHQIKVGERTAEQIKIQVGAVYADLDDAPADFTVWGANMMDTMPRKVEVNYREIAECLDNSIGRSRALSSVRSKLRLPSSTPTSSPMVSSSPVVVHSSVVSTSASLSASALTLRSLRTPCTL